MEGTDMFRMFSTRGVKVGAVGAVLAVASLIAAPAHAATGPLGDMLVNGSASGTSAVSFVDKGDVSAEFLGTEYPCDGATATGTATAGDVTSGGGIVISDLLVDNCDTVGGLTLDVTETCALTLSFTPGQTVDTGLVDHAVAGTLNAGTSATPCLRGQGGSGLFTCTVDVYGSVPVTVDEDKLSGQQNLTIAGSGLLMRNGSGVCGIIPNGTAISLNVDFNFDVATGPVNFVP
jgi:hypothetical protein